ncbi:MAG: DUF29 domain-containing protein [Cyanobacteria bacterium J06621_8]
MVSPNQEIQTKETSPLYRQDYCLWLDQTIEKLKNKELEKVDIDHLIEDLELMGGSERRALESNLVVVLLHLLKYKYQPEKRSRSWLSSIFEHRRRIRKAFKNSPSLKRHFSEELTECYQDSRKLAAIETGLAIDTFPIACPFAEQEVLDEEFLP